MELQTTTSPHNNGPSSVSSVMLWVVMALIPGSAAYVWFFGWSLLVNICIAITIGLITEALILLWRRRPVKPFLSDGSAIVTALLLAMTIPPLAPWWITVIGIFFAIAVAKHLYGGIGYNPFNPAMIGYVMLLISFPREMTSWSGLLTLSDVSLNFKDSLIFIFTQQLPTDVTYDALTEATPLDTMKTHLGMGNTITEIRAQLGLDEETSQLLSVTPIFGAIGGKGWEWINGAFLFGGLILIYKKIISWHTPVAILLALGTISGMFYLFDAEHNASPLFHLFSGATFLGAFFIATDPVTAAATPRGRIVFGIGIGVLIYIIRTWGGYPDSVAFAVLIMNMVVPVIDHYFKPRVFGHRN